MDCDTPRRMRRRSAASRYLEEKWGVPASPKSLAKWACTGQGPAFHRGTGRVPLYDQADLDAWAIERIGPKVKSTSEYGKLGGLGAGEGA
jgi:hypothetical protein